MKFRTSKKDIKSGYHKIISVGYCDLQSLLNGLNPVAYSSGYHGWSCDYYDIDGVCICTGYSPVKPQNTKKLPYTRIKWYENEAQRLTCNAGSWHECKTQLRELLKEFIAECTID